MTNDQRIAVTVIGGYLGSGKTTLVNHILRDAAVHDSGERIAVLVNDFGDINIDADLIESRGDNTIELANGCICCSIVDGFAAALDTITAFDPRPDRLVIEASGVSDPAAVAAYAHGPGLMLDAVVVLTDAETIRERVGDKYVGQMVDQQLGAGHVVVVNKVDLVGDEAAAATVSWMTERCPEAFVTSAEHSQVASELLFGRMAETPAVHDNSDDNHSDHHHSGHDHSDHSDHSGHHGDDHAHVDHSAAFRTWSIERDQPMTRADVAVMMDELPETVVRAKGFVWLDNSPDQPAILQRVGKRWTLRRMGQWPGAPATRIVVIEISSPIA